ncbi:interphotoreceptor matrix proteoglycan 1 isoform X2 [Mixophyes fleayi]|uniref:interphotoreceptor matrix proteoglycan 1 isoform X2 n=1 Tax=Mixophyes fleayi TaxID=3061075 RepID=UPI003F4DD781
MPNRTLGHHIFFNEAVETDCIFFLNCKGNIFFLVQQLSRQHSNMNCKSGLLLIIICIFIQCHCSKEIDSKSRLENNIISASSQPNAFQKISRISTIRRLFDLKKLRTKRSTIFPTGVKVCPQESLKQIIASHLAYYRLRVCQEAVWEAFRIFMDRIPQTAEYQSWVDVCQQESFCISDIGRNFSSSQEHLDIVSQRVKEKKIPEKKNEISAEGTLSPVITEEPSVSTTGFPYSPSASLVTSNDTLFNEIINDTKHLLKETEVTNLVPEQPKQQTVEFTVTLNNQQFTAELSDPNTPQYQELATNFQNQMQKVFEKLPGFKEIKVLRFRKKKDKYGSDSIVVRYAVVFEKGSSESKNKIDETSTITSNKVENGNNGDAIEMSYTVTELQEMVAMALRDDRSLTLDLQTLLFSDDPDIPLDPLESDVHPSVTVSTSKMKTDLDEVSIVEVPLGNPTAEIVQQSTGDETPASTVTPDKNTINLVNEIVAETPTVPISVSYTDTLLPEEYGTSPISFQDKVEVDLQSPSLEEIIRDIDNIIKEGFTVPLDTPYTKSEVINRNVIEVIVDNNLIGTSSDTPSDTWGEFVPSSTSTVFPYMTMETARGHTSVKTENTFIMDKIVVTLPSVVETPSGDGEWHADHPSTDKTYGSSLPTDWLTSENINAVFPHDETSTTEPVYNSTVKTLPGYIDSSLLFSFTTLESGSNILAISPSESPFRYEETEASSTTKVAAALKSTTQEAIGMLEEVTPEVTQLLEETTPVNVGMGEGTTSKVIEVFEENSSIEVGILEGTTTEVVEVLEKTTPVQEGMVEESTLKVIAVLEETTPELVGVFEYTTPKVEVIEGTTPTVVAVIKETAPKIIALEETTPEVIKMFDETTTISTLTPIFLTTEQLRVSESVPKYDNKNNFSIMGDATTTASVLESNFTETSVYLSKVSATSQSQMNDSDREMNNEQGILTVTELDESEDSTSSPDTLSNNTAAFSLLGNSTSSTESSADKGKELVVFFSLRVTNMPFSDDLFNKSSPEYKALEQQFLHLLLPYLQSNLTGFRNLEILNFRKGSVIVNSKLKFAKSLPYNVTKAVHCVLEDFCNAAAQLLNLEIDSFSLDIEPADQANPCKFMACDEFSECVINSWTKEAACICKPGYISIDGLPCQSICDLEPNHCSGGEQCEIVAGKGAVCSCLKGKSWFQSGTHCSKSTAENVSLMVAAATAALFLAFILLKLVGKMYGSYNHKTQSEVNVKSYSLHSFRKINPAFYHDENLKSPNSLLCPTSACISPTRDTDHRRLHTPQHTQLSVRRLPVAIMQENLKSRQ